MYSEKVNFLNEGNYLIVQANKFSMARYDMGLIEQKLFLILIATIQKEDNRFKDVCFKVGDLAMLLNISQSNLYRDLKKVCRSLNQKTIDIQKANGDWFTAPIMKYAEYHKKQGTITLCLNEVIEPYFLGLKKFFTKYYLENVLKLNSKYAMRIYQLSKCCQYQGEFIISLEELREMLQLTAKSYQAFKAINAKVLKPSVQEINDKTDINVDVQPLRVCRKVEHIKFVVNSQRANVPPTRLQPQQSEGKKSQFSDYKMQRKYDYKKLEEKLLGWDKGE